MTVQDVEFAAGEGHAADMALCLRVPMQLPHKFKYQGQCCGYLTWNKIRSIKKKAREKFSVLGLPHKGIRDLSWSSREAESDPQKYFDDLGETVGGPYLKLLKGLTRGIPEPPTEGQWKFQSGWTRYTRSGSSLVSFPKEDAVVFDVEVCVKEGFYPTLAAAVSQDAWYLWVSPRLVDRDRDHPSTLTPDDLIPMGSTSCPRVVVGHFISYDRARIRENYSIVDSGTRYFDTLSAHTCVSGVTNIQRNLMFSTSYDKEGWRQLTSPNSLEKVSEFYCGTGLNKASRDIFVNGSLQEIAADFQSLSTYCVEDVIATHKVLCKLLPLFLERQPHLLSLAGMLELSTPFMPVGKSWRETLETVKSTACDLKEKQSSIMKSCADKILPLVEGQRFRADPWMWDQDWKLQKWNGRIYPTWYKNFYLGYMKSVRESDGTSIAYAGLTVPKILRLRCGPYPLHYINRLGWGVIVPTEIFVGNINTYLEDEMPVLPEDQITQLCYEAVAGIRVPKVPTVSGILELIESDLYWRESVSASSSSTPNTATAESPSADNVNELLISDKFVFRRLLNVGGMRPVRNPLGITMAKSLTLLNSPEPEGEDFLEIRDQLSPWLSHGSRWKAQSVVTTHPDSGIGVILPMMEVCADYLRLPRERAWSSLISLDDSQLGADLLESVKPRRNFRFLTATIDDLDLWLAALLSDSVQGALGATEFSSLLAAGRLFSEMAAALETSPEEAKCLCHAVVAGADAYVLSKFICQTRVYISKDEAYQRACRCMDLLLDYKLFSVNPSDSWAGIGAEQLRTPLLGARLSRPLELEKHRVRLRAQWLVHSTKVDFLHMLVACYRAMQPSVRLSFVHGDAMSLYFLVQLQNNAVAEQDLMSAYRKVQAFCLSRLGFPPTPDADYPPLRISVTKTLRPE